MNKLWEKNFEVNAEIERFTVGRDREMDLYLAKYDVLGSMAHITMLESIGLIGKEEESIQRNTGDVEVVSENYLTWKRQVKKSKISDDTMPIEKWTRLQKRPLEKLGDHLLY